MITSQLHLLYLLVTSSLSAIGSQNFAQFRFKYSSLRQPLCSFRQHLYFYRDKGYMYCTYYYLLGFVYLPIFTNKKVGKKCGGSLLPPIPAYAPSVTLNSIDHGSCFIAFRITMCVPEPTLQGVPGQKEDFL